MLCVYECWAQCTLALTNCLSAGFHAEFFLKGERYVLHACKVWEKHEKNFYPWCQKMHIFMLKFQLFASRFCTLYLQLQSSTHSSCFLLFNFDDYSWRDSSWGADPRVPSPPPIWNTDQYTCMWSLSSHHYGDKETMDNILILHQVQWQFLVLMCRGNGTQGGFGANHYVYKETMHKSSSDIQR